MRSHISRRNSVTTLLCIVSVMGWSQAQAMRVHKPVFRMPWTSIDLVGCGIVVGLPGSGDTDIQQARRTLSILQRNGDPGITAAELKSGHVADVMVTARVHRRHGVGDRIDVTVHAIGDAISLVGGRLLATPLLGPKNEVYAMAGGQIDLDAASLGPENGAIAAATIMGAAPLWRNGRDSVNAAQLTTTVEPSVPKTIRRPGWFRRCFSKLTWNELLTLTESPRNICSRIKAFVRYKKDMGDNWTGGRETWERGYGDCEDISACVDELCKANGFNSSMYVLHTSKDGVQQGHVIVVGTWNGRKWMADNAHWKSIDSMDDAKRKTTKSLGWSYANTHIVVLPTSGKVPGAYETSSPYRSPSM